MEMKKYKLYEIADYVSSKVSTSQLSLQDYITTDCLLQNKCGRECAENLPPQSVNVTAFKPGDILIANIRPYLKKIWYANSEGGNSADVLTIRAKDGFEKLYVYYALFQDSFFDYATKGAKGSKMPRGDKDQIMNFEILVPENLQVQKKIASTLSDFDKRIENLRAQNRVLEQTAKTIYDYTFLQCAGHQTTYNKTLNRNIPANWEVKNIGEILDKVSATTKIETKLYQQSGKYPIIDQSTNFIAGYTDDESAVIRKTPAVFFGDHTRIVKMINFAFARGSDGTQILYSKENTVGPHYLYFAVKSIELPNMGYARHFKFLKDKSIAIPDKNTSDSFEKIIQPLFDKILINRKQIETLTTQRNTLLPLLMTGQVEV